MPRRRFVIRTKEQYEIAKERVEKGAKVLKGKWFDSDPTIKSNVQLYQALCEAMLRYEIDNNLLHIETKPKKI